MATRIATGRAGGRRLNRSPDDSSQLTCEKFRELIDEKNGIAISKLLTGTPKIIFDRLLEKSRDGNGPLSVAMTRQNGSTYLASTLIPATSRVKAAIKRVLMHGELVPTIDDSGGDAPKLLVKWNGEQVARPPIKSSQSDLTVDVQYKYALLIDIRYRGERSSELTEWLAMMLDDIQGVAGGSERRAVSA